MWNKLLSTGSSTTSHGKCNVRVYANLGNKHNNTIRESFKQF